jgi:hypothetical protein
MSFLIKEPLRSYYNCFHSCYYHRIKRRYTANIMSLEILPRSTSYVLPKWSRGKKRKKTKILLTISKQYQKKSSIKLSLLLLKVLCVVSDNEIEIYRRYGVECRSQL